MNAETFYEQFKNSLKLLHLEWGEKEKTTVRAEDNKILICRTEDDFIGSAIIDLNKEEPKTKL